MKIEWTAPAVDDLTGVRDHIARDSELYAGRFVGRKVPEAEEQEAVREILFQGYRIIYRLKPEKVQILSVLHGSRDLAHREPKPWEVS
jgi:plasmid stabilization system protein ParE